MFAAFASGKLASVLSTGVKSATSIPAEDKRLLICRQVGVLRRVKYRFGEGGKALDFYGKSRECVPG